MGYPTRPDRDNFGPTVVNTTPVRNPQRQVGADQFNLLWHQVSGSGLVVPRIAFHFTADNPDVQLGRVEAWNPKRLTSGAYIDPVITRNGVGDYTIEYPTPIPDEQGNDIAISFQWASAIQANADPTVLKHVQASPVAISPSHIRVGVFNAAGAAEDGNDVVVFGW